MGVLGSLGAVSSLVDAQPSILLHICSSCRKEIDHPLLMTAHHDTHEPPSNINIPDWFIGILLILVY